MNDILQQLMRDATRLTRAGRLDEATEAIQRALRGEVPAPAAPSGTTPKPDAAEPMKSVAVTLDATATEPGGNVFTVDTRDYDAAEADFAAGEAAHHQSLQTTTDYVHEEKPVDFGVNNAPGEFISGTHTHASKSLHYKLYVPAVHAHTAQPLPLVVMMHGCTQDPDDFAAGTGMNEVAREQGFFVLYPAQSQSANASRCWNWFQPGDQKRGRGEPALIAAMTKAVMKQHHIDPRRVYIAGLSAGGAMATIIAEAYPEIFAAVGVHSGLPRGAASNVMEAFSVMQSGDTAARMSGIRMQMSVPTIVFHGDQDQTVHPRNGEQVIAAVLSGDGADAWQFPAGDGPRIEKGRSATGRRYTRATYADDHGTAMVEHWVVHGAGHAWSGGDASGTYTDADGPDATREMLRFFRAHPRYQTR
ncbi:MAG: PHB depolymerase family esterase [Burkholderiales bacterium]|nr:PHB depolymerase family esterase [Burkholderiales bacterium]